jgi:hypothetical protein
MIIPYAYTLTSILVQEKFQANVEEAEAEAEEEIEGGGGRGEEEEAANHIHKENIVELPTLLIPICTRVGSYLKNPL